jgi:DNA-binding PucR family transcriptional regulator
MARPAADAEARALLEAGDQLAAVDRPPRVLRADRLAEYRLLGSLHNLPDGERHARALVAPLLVGSARVQEERLSTLAAFLDGAGQAAAAGALGVHRNTISYRLRRIEALTGWSLDDPELRFAVSLALRLVRKPQI